MPPWVDFDGVLFVDNSRVLLIQGTGSVGNLSRWIPNSLIVHDMFSGRRETDSLFFLMSAHTATILQFLQRKNLLQFIISSHPAMSIEGEDRSTVDT